MSVIALQAEITGYKGPAVNILAAVDGGTGLVIVSQEVAFGERSPGALIVCNDPRAPSRDLLFDEGKLAGAIERYFRADSTGMVELLSAVQRHKPSNAIQATGLDASGTRYQLSPEITNGQIAVLAIVYAASNSLSIEDTAEFAQDMADMFMTI
ncbi:hypothetical protein [Burkholderia ubonensis]|uniref:Uncharacterized protein n=1 Tax=Burkholderia ubonensis TaxID=101571 RepID=A0ABD4E1H3_9BURK|nr:hypothetical protein [Burkholderia ubonensis]KVN83420.1 hypothetical protein WJ68_16015 [Burkholderia ubonensis]